MPDTPTAFPLVWPASFPRTPYANRKEGQFKRHGSRISVFEAFERVQEELARIRARDVIVSTDIELRRDGAPRSDRPPVSSSGVAIYFKLRGKPVVLPCDRYFLVADNLAAVAAHIEATRAIERHGVGTLEQLFTGFMALPAPVAAARPWWQVLGWDAEPGGNAAIIVAENRYRELMKKAHPDAGGSQERAAELNAAIAEARKVLS